MPIALLLVIRSSCCKQMSLLGGHTPKLHICCCPLSSMWLQYKHQWKYISFLFKCRSLMFLPIGFIGAPREDTPHRKPWISKRNVWADINKPENFGKWYIEDLNLLEEHLLERDCAMSGICSHLSVLTFWRATWIIGELWLGRHQCAHHSEWFAWGSPHIKSPD